VLQSWSSANVVTWTPASPSNPYQVQVQVRGSWNTGASEREASLNYQIFNPLTVTLTSNLSSPRPASTTIRWTAHPSGQSQARYQWVLFDGTAWLNLTGWTATNTFDWTPAVPNASYRVGVRVRSDWSTGPAEDTEILPFVIQ